MPAEIPVEKITAGDSWDRTFEIRRPVAEDPTTTEPMPFVTEGWDGWQAQWRRRPSSPETPITLLVDDTQADVGIISLSASPAQTRLMGEDGVWDLQATQGARVKTWLKGSFDWESDVTRD